MQDNGVVQLSSTPLCLASHGTEAVLALGLAEGGITVTKIDATAVRNATHHVPSTCLTTEFQSGPATTFFAGTEGIVHLFDIERPEPIHKFRLPLARKNDHASSHTDDDQNLSTGSARVPSKIYSYDAHTFLVGDDDGGIHLYDVRVGKDSGPTGCVAETFQQADYISTLQRVEKYGTRAILATSGDGTLCAYDVRRLPTARVKLEYAFDKFDDDILSLGIVECSNGESIGVAGTLCGMLNMYNMKFLDVESDPDTVAHVDRFPGHPECVNSVLTCATADVVVTASSDGFVRVVDVLSKTLVGVLDYCDNVVEADKAGSCSGNGDSLANAKRRKKKRKYQSSKWPIESMVRINGTEKLGFALTCHDEYVRFCDASALVDDNEESCDDKSRKGGGVECDAEGDDVQASDKEGTSGTKTVLSFPPEAALVRRDKKGRRRKNNQDDRESTGNPFFEDL